MPEKIKEILRQKNLGRKVSDATKQKLSITRIGNTNGFKKGKLPWNKGLKGVMVAWNKGISPTKETIEKIRKANIGKKQSPETIFKRSQKMIGDKNPNFIDGKLRHGKKHYYDLRWKIWKKSVFERDNYTCQKCFKVGGYIQPHHIKSWTYFPDLRYDLNNGLTLCRECHKLTDNYCGRGIRKTNHYFTEMTVAIK